MHVAGHRTPRVAAARKLAARPGRRRAGRFLAEGAQAVREALRYGQVHELFVTDPAAERHRELVGSAERADIPVTRIDRRAAELLSETVTPQGIVAVCEFVDVRLEQAILPDTRLVAVLVDVSDPGNAGTVLRTADAAGVDAVIFAGEAVDPHNGKCVRASAGSLFHLPVARGTLDDVLAACRGAGLRITTTDGVSGQDLTETSDLGGARAWLFGSEAHGLPPEVIAGADERLRVPIYGDAESLNLATAASVCLYAAAMDRRGDGPARSGDG